MTQAEIEALIKTKQTEVYKEGYNDGYAAGEQDANDRQAYQEQREAEDA